jgi:hypothetical protein
MIVTTKLGNWEVTGDVKTGWEGDPALPGGTRWLWTVEEIEAFTEEGEEILDLTQEQYEECEVALILEVKRSQKRF